MENFKTARLNPNFFASYKKFIDQTTKPRKNVLSYYTFLFFLTRLTKFYHGKDCVKQLSRNVTCCGVKDSLK